MEPKRPRAFSDTARSLIIPSTPLSVQDANSPALRSGVPFTKSFPNVEQHRFQISWNPRLLRFIIGAVLLLGTLLWWFPIVHPRFLPLHSTLSNNNSSSHPAEAKEAISQNNNILDFGGPTRLPLIPPKIWQIHLSDKPSREALDPSWERMHSWIANSRSDAYTILDSTGAEAILALLAQRDPKRHARLPALWSSLSRPVLRADFLRYLVLAVEGGAYGDLDTELLKPLYDWVPAEYRERAKLVVGLETDQNPPVPQTFFPVQFCQWTMATGPDHPVLWGMIEHILREVSARSDNLAKEAVMSDNEVLQTTGPAAWTVVMFEQLSIAAGRNVTWEDLTGMRKPRLFGDILVMPIDAFGSGQGHSGSTQGDPPENALVKHAFASSWRTE